MKVGKIVASIVQLFSREIVAVGEDRIYNNDSDNLYPNRVELVERNSVTAASCSNKLKSFIVGKGFADKTLNEMIVNTRKGVNGYKFLTNIAESLKTHRGVFIHINYGIDNQPNYVEVLDFKKCRVAKEDSEGYPGCIYYKDWSKVEKKFQKSNENECRWFYPYNPDDKVINLQRRKDAKIRKLEDPQIEDVIRAYRGQVMFINLDEYEVYPNSWLHAVYNDADTEFRLSLYRNTNMRNGFLDKTIIIPNGIDEEAAETFSENIKKWLGAENTSSVMVYQPDTPVDDPSKIFHTIQMKGNYDTERFKNDEEAIANNIRKSYLAIPKLLIDPADTFFSASGEAFKEAVRYYNAETLFLRDVVTYALERIYKNKNKDFSIRELGTEDLQVEEQPRN